MGRKSSFLLPFLVHGWVSITKDRLIRKTLHIYLIQVLHDTGMFIRKQRPKEAVKSEHFYARFDEKWGVLGKHDRTKSMSLFRFLSTSFHIQR